MANPRVSTDDVQVHISFTITDPLQGYRQQSSIRALLQKKFGMNEVEQVLGLQSGGNEVIFKIATPAIHTDGMLREFFLALRFVLNATREFTPHFTQSTKDLTA